MADCINLLRHGQKARCFQQWRSAASAEHAAQVRGEGAVRHMRLQRKRRLLAFWRSTAARYAWGLDFQQAGAL